MGKEQSDRTQQDLSAEGLTASQQEQRERYIESVMGYIQHLNAPDRETFFDITLEDVGLLLQLETVGIVPALNSSVDEQQINRELDRRQQVLKAMEIGGVLQHYFPHLSPRLAVLKQAPAKETQELQGQHKAVFLESLSDTEAMSIAEIMFESMLERTGLQYKLEEKGVLLRSINPNPYNCEAEEDLHEQWWNKHLEAYEQYSKDVQYNEQMLKHMCLGALIRDAFTANFAA